MMNETSKRELAWIGDAVLALYARRWILQRQDIPHDKRAEAFTAMTSNQFLSSLGEPTQVEATIGQLYETEGLDAANQWMEEHIAPTFHKRWNRKTSGKQK